jgi:hypothetical protein
MPPVRQWYFGILTQCRIIGDPTVPGLKNQVGPASEKALRKWSRHVPMWRASFCRALGLRQIVPRPHSPSSSRIRTQTHPLMILVNGRYLSAMARSSVSIQPEYPTRFELSVPSRTHAYRADQISRNRHCVSDMFRVVLSLHIDPLIEELSLSIYACVFGLRWGCLKSPGRLR